MATNTTERTEKGVSLARGPALILGTILEVAGLYFLYKQHGFPKLSNFPNGDAPVQGKVFFGIFGVNGWTGLFTAAAGGLLLFGAAQHLLAKTMSLIVGVALGAAAIIAVISGNVLGLAAANGWTRLGWGVCAVILLFNTMIPRRRRTVQEPVAADERPAARTRTPAPAPTGDSETRAQTGESETRAQTGEPETTTQTGDPATRSQVAESETPNQTAEPGARKVVEPTTRTQPATEPLVTRDPEATGGDRGAMPADREVASADREVPPTASEAAPGSGERLGPADDGGAVGASEAETTRHRPLEE